MNGLFDEVSGEKAWISCIFIGMYIYMSYIFIGIFFTVCHCAKESSYCDNVLDDDVPLWGGESSTTRVRRRQGWTS